MAEKGIDNIVSALTKRNRAGQQQPYVPSGHGDESGEYRDNAYGGFSSYSKPNKPNIGVQVKDSGDKKVKTESIKSKYDGKGKQVLNDELSARLKKGKNAKILLDSIIDSDDEYCGIIGDFYKDNPQIEIKLGKNLNSKFQATTYYSYFGGNVEKKYSVYLGQGVYTDDEYYSKGGVFFHESGHALDSSFVNIHGNRGDWSVDYISEKYGKSMAMMIQEEMTTNLTPDVVDQIKKEIADKQAKYESEIWNAEMENEYQGLLEYEKSLYKALTNDAQYQSLVNKSNELLKDMSNKHSLYTGDPINSEKVQNFIDSKKAVLEHQKVINEYQREFYQKNYPEKENMLARKNELNEKKWSAHSIAKAKICVEYGDLSDMAKGSIGKDLCNMGHAESYWSRRTRGNEAFAEIMSAKATNPQSLELIKKYAPKTVEMFDEIIGIITEKGVRANG